MIDTIDEDPRKMPADLSQAKLEKEVDKLSAEVDKLRAETANLNVRQTGFRRNVERGAALLIALGGFATAFATCQGASLQEQAAALAKTRAELEKAKAEDDVRQAHVQSETALAQKRKVDEDLRLAQQTLAQVKADYESVARKVVALKEGGAGEKAQLTQAVQDLGDRLDNASEVLAASAPVRTVGTILLFPALPAQSEAAESLRAALSRQSFKSVMKPPLKRAERAPQQTEVRYFRDADAATARRIIDVMREAGQRATPSLVDDPDITFPRYFEVHYAARTQPLASSK